ncbi:MAG: sugar phosphate isomerase/epimerase family protein [Ignisphaera sp.]|uniref:Sugar phosphate isomerase/epimerase n=1 Tax=Ignisphaera aggregans TaxID=334771 RepID=A0A7C4NME7_9CREN
MRLAIVSDEITQDFEHALKVINELGVELVEIRSLWNKNIVELADTELDNVKNLLRSYGLRVSHVASPAFKIYIDDEKGFEQHLRFIRRAIELTKLFDLNYTRIFTFWWQGNLELYLDLIIDRIQHALDIAKDEGIYLIIENEYSCFIGTGFETKVVLEKIKSPWLKVLWDPGNAFFARETPYPIGYNYVKDHVMYMHLKDAVVDERGRFVWRPIGKGAIDYYGQLKEVAKKDIIVSLETHYAPQGGTKEDGTRESFRGLMDIVNKIKMEID